MTDENKQAKNTQPDTGTSCELTDQETADVAGGLTGVVVCGKCGTSFAFGRKCPKCNK